MRFSDYEQTRLRRGRLNKLNELNKPELNAELFIAKRYIFSKKNFSFITIISLISIAGVAIGVAALIIVLSVFNGFGNKVTSLLVNFDPHVRIESTNSAGFSDYENVIKKLKENGIKAAAPFTLNKGMLANESSNEVVFIKGVEEESAGNVSGIKNVLRFGKFDLKDEGDCSGIVLGFTLMGKMKSRPGDTITLLSPVGLESSLTQFIDPLTRKFVVRGVYDSENKEYDGNYAYISLGNSQHLFDMNGKANGIEIRLDDINDSENIKKQIMSFIGDEYKVMTWYDLHKDFYSLLKIERWTAFSVLSIIIAVASFNILGSLTMTVIEKKRDIGVLKAMGATEKMITRIFIYEGVFVGIIGIIAGLIIGLGVTLSQLYFEFYKLDASIYKITALPVELRLTDFLFIPVAAFVLCFLASIYPSRRAANLDPVQAIRWE